MSGGPPEGPIHRVVSEPPYDINAAQRGLPGAVCRNEISQSWISGVKYDPVPKKGDEYPFACLRVTWRSASTNAGTCAG